ncbi:ammonium transporter, partial [Escherichia coli]|nr:ammonium transporter [Escherichia coli]
GKYDMASQLWVQTQGVLTTLVLSGGVSLVLFLLLKFTIGIRPSKEVEVEGLDINAHGERAYNY